MLCDVLQQMLELDGHRVLSAGNGMAALEIYRGEPNIDLIISDQMMPKLDGAGFINALRLVASQTPVLVILGGVLTSRDAHGEIPSGAASAFLAKPFDRAQLQLAVATLLA